MLIVTGMAEVGEGSVEKVIALARMMAAESRKEPGCRSYGFYQDLDTPTRFRIYEEWDDEAALAAHFKMPHMAAFNAGLKDIEIKSISVQKCEAGPMSPVM